MSYNLQNLSMIYMDKYADPKNNSFYKSRPVADTSLLMLKEAVIYDQKATTSNHFQPILNRLPRCMRNWAIQKTHFFISKNSTPIKIPSIRLTQKKP
ncbi:hypothetical protein H9W95_05110 [Flavobacterium lindanitolerans]|nr:hypothetical protein [Flavobacterium lindanitolerans]